MRRFLTDNAPWLAAGGMLTFGSSFGQTYFIALFAAEIRGTFELSHAAWGGAYALGTLASAALVLIFGGLADRWPAPSFALLVLAGLALSCLALSALPAAWMLPAVICGLRFFGQGMLPHLAMVLAGRWFVAARGRAVSIMTLGFTAGEMVLPLIFVQLLALAGWRGSWAVAALIPVLLMPAIALLLRRSRQPKGRADEAETGSAGLDGRHWTRGEVVGHWLFWALMPAVLALPIFGTAFMFQQVHMIEQKGWDLATYFALFPLYPLSQIGFLMLGGMAVDRFGAGRVLSVALLPFAVATSVFAVGETVWVAVPGFVLIGAMMGLSAASLGALWPELYGTRHHGAVRSVASSTMVFGTALGPVLTGGLIDVGIAYEHQLLAITLYVVGVSAFAAWALTRARSGKTVDAA